MRFLIVFLVLALLSACGDATEAPDNSTDPWQVDPSDEHSNADPAPNQPPATNDDTEPSGNGSGPPSTDPQDPDCPSAEEVVYFSRDYEECELIDPVHPPGVEFYSSEECGCGYYRDSVPTEQPCHIDGCPDGEYCHYSDGRCGETGIQGVCRPAPTVCTDDLVEICGCDGAMRYGSSSCGATHDGVDAHQDSSYCSGETCLDPDDPDVNYYGESVGECAAIDFMCPQGEQRFDNPCGCGCLTVEDTDPDPGPGEACDIDGCPDGHYCHYPDGQCGDTGVQGICEPLTLACTDDINTVCGCDGEFHIGSSTCAAQFQGVDSTDPSYCDDHQCPDPDDEDVEYVSQDPGECAAILFTCQEGETLFNDDCGCGCIVD